MDPLASAGEKQSVSVTMPCFNRGHIMADAVESALAREPAIREIILVDDGSTDDTLDVLERLAAEDAADLVAGGYEERMFELMRRGVGWRRVPARRSKWLTAAGVLGYRRVEQMRSLIAS